MAQILPLAVTADLEVDALWWHDAEEALLKVKTHIPQNLCSVIQFGDWMFGEGFLFGLVAQFRILTDTICIMCSSLHKMWFRLSTSFWVYTQLLYGANHCDLLQCIRHIVRGTMVHLISHTFHAVYFFSLQGTPLCARLSLPSCVNPCQLWFKTRRGI